MSNYDKQWLIENYRGLLAKHGRRPEAVQWSPEGQVFRFEKLVQVADLNGAKILDVGCGIGSLYEFLTERFSYVDYLGVDIVPEMIASAARWHPAGRFLCHDLLEKDLEETFDYVLISGVFNNAIPQCTEFLKDLIAVSFRHCKQALGFNFISTYVNEKDAEMAYHDPAEIFEFCIQKLTRKVTMCHHYERCDVVVFAYR